MPSQRDTIDALKRRIAELEQNTSSAASSAESEGRAAGARTRVGGSSRKKAEGEHADEEKDTSPEAAFTRAVSLISHAPRTSRDLSTRLKREGFPEASVSAAIERAKRCGLLDDVSYAEQFAETRLARGYGLNRISQELARKGIDVESLGFWHGLREEQDPDAEYEAALAFARGRTFTSKHPGQALFAALMRRGYSSSCAYRVIRAMNLPE